MVPGTPNRSWSMDFMRDTLTSGCVFRTLNLIDEFNREVLAIEVDTSLPSARVIRVLNKSAWRPLPQSIFFGEVGFLCISERIFSVFM